MEDNESRCEDLRCQFEAAKKYLDDARIYWFKNGGSKSSKGYAERCEAEEDYQRKLREYNNCKGEGEQG